ncbi:MULTISPECIES: hypothetical protein [unclassified Chryseobacterium]|uniref:hypothetical protein n=1 Tax=unclassified Chryseobacterium TaxID=2593645 RepID=UPI001E60B66B|nr:MULTISPECIES: hypothetical protein [unclassified Chryseobacterium]MCQ9637661.1 hypothetical protein [Chryseobacterium sp. WG23]
MEETQQGIGHFLVWSVRGFTSLSYKVDLLRLICDFLLFFIIIFCAIFFIKKAVNKWFKIIIYVISFIIILLLVPYFLITEIYFEKIACQVIYSSFSLGWF